MIMRDIKTGPANVSVLFDPSTVLSADQRAVRIGKQFLTEDNLWLWCSQIAIDNRQTHTAFVVDITLHIDLFFFAFYVFFISAAADLTK